MTIKDVAKLSGYSIATVSRAMNNQRNVDENIRAKILECAKTLGYSPNILGKSLRNKDSGIIMCIMVNINNNFLADAFLSAQKRLNNEGYQAILCPVSYDSDYEKKLLQLLEGRLMAGVIFFGTTLGRQGLEELNVRFPLVQCSEHIEGSETAYVSIENRLAAFEGVTYLIQNGHTRIGMISSIFGIGSTKNREAGYREALELAGIPFAPELIRKGNYEPESGYQAAMELLALPEPPTAYFCVSDSMACGCIRALCNSGINVPDDVSVLGFDNSPFARTMVPSITTIGLPYAAIGKKAAELLLDQLKNYNKSNEGVLLPHELVLRESVKPLVC